MNPQELIKQIVNKPPRIAVVGDYILDKYIQTEVSRISPEAPVMVARQIETKESHGGAGNVWATLVNLGCDAILFCNGDPSQWTHEIGKSFINPQQFSTKTRIMCGDHHLMRIDDEPAANEIEWTPYRNLSWANDFEAMCANREFDCVVIADYHKGVVNKNVAEMVIELCDHYGIPTIVDAKKDFDRFYGASLIKCNHKEAEELWKAYPLGTKHIVVTNGKSGIQCYKTPNVLRFDSVNGLDIHAADVCGAGDTVTAILALCMAMPLESQFSDVVTACKLANFLAAEACKHPGVYVVSQEDLMKYGGV